jgi:hypothetical protein
MPCDMVGHSMSQQFGTRVTAVADGDNSSSLLLEARQSCSNWFLLTQESSHSSSFK